ncbi:MAG: hypothetical protein J1E16_09475 [Muribaculaceae bacterium]|nr:hypothetical protein [Muribaculaceae bacterium]
MKKLILISIALSTTLAVNAEVNTRQRSDLPQSKTFAKHDITGDITINGRTLHIIPTPASKEKISTRSDEYGTPIWDAPGTQRYYCKDVIGYGEGMPIQAYALASYINWDGDDAYILDVVTGAPIGSYVKATRHDEVLEMPMGQPVLDFDDEDYSLVMGLMRPIITVVTDDEGSEDIFIWFEYSDDYDSLYYTIDDNGSLVLESPEAKYSLEESDPAFFGLPYYVIGYYYSDDKVWSGFCDVFQAFDEFNYTLVELPEGLEMQTFSYINIEGNGVIVSVGEKDNALYFKGMSEYAPDAVFKADIIEDGTKISVAPNQFIGLEAELYFVITSTVKQDRFGQLEVVEDDRPVYFNLERDPQTGKILSITSDDSGYYLALNDDPFYFYPLDVFMDLELKSQDSFEGIPSTPYAIEYYDYTEWLGANFIFFKLSSFANNGDIIDTNKLYYTIYLNGDPYEFQEENGFNLLGEETTMYYGMKEPTELIPYNFNNSRDLYEDSGGTFVVGLYVEGIETVGVQAVYEYNDIVTTSALVTLDVATGEQTVTGGTEAKVDSITSAEVVETEYYNLNGLKVKHPEKGIYLKVNKLSDGKTVVRKVAK